jgi:hypothetical protein
MLCGSKVVAFRVRNVALDFEYIMLCRQSAKNKHQNQIQGDGEPLDNFRLLDWSSLSTYPGRAEGGGKADIIAVYGLNILPTNED